MNTVLSSARARRSTLALFGSVVLVAGVGCNQQGQARNPTFTAATAPEPTTVVAPITCSPAHPSPEGEALAQQFRKQVSERLGVPGVDLPMDQQNVLCSALFEDKTRGVSATSALMDAASKKDDWSPSTSVSSIVQGVAKTANAKSVFVVIAHRNDRCYVGDMRISEDGKRVIRTNEESPRDHFEHFEDCKESGAYLRAFVFSSEGALYWKSWAPASNATSVPPGVAALLANVPAKFSPAAAAATASSPELVGPKPDEARRVASP